jgi:HSP20 family protein
MAIVRWEPFGELDRILGNVFEAPLPRASTLRRWMPATDVVEAEDHYVLRADLPGLAEEDVNIEVEDRILTLSGERKSEYETTEAGYHRVERAFGSFSRSVTLPEGIDPGTISAKFDRGVLEIRIPKPAQRKPRKISIGVGDTPKTIESDSAA